MQPVADEVNVIMDVPGETPVTRPPPGVIVATPVDALVHVPTTASLNWVVAVGQTVKVPTIAAGAALTVTNAVAEQPGAVEYVINDVPRPETPVTVVVVDGPVVAVATVVVPLVHVPPVVASLNIVVVPGHKFNVPDIAPGGDVTVTSTLVVQLVADAVKVILVVPVTGDIDDTSPPPGVIVATDVVALLHVPSTELLNWVVDPEQTLVDPVIAGGEAVTVIVVVTEQPGPVE